MVQCDLTEENTEAIVNPTESKFGLVGAISKKILEKDGQQIGNDFAKLGTLNDVRMTKAAGQLECKQLVHVLSPRSIFEIPLLFKQMLQFVSQKELHLLSILLVGADFGLGGIPQESELPSDQQIGQAANFITDAVVFGVHLKSIQRKYCLGFFLEQLQQSLNFSDNQ